MYSCIARCCRSVPLTSFYTGKDGLTGPLLGFRATNKTWDETRCTSSNKELKVGLVNSFGGDTQETSRKAEEDKHQTMDEAARKAGCWQRFWKGSSWAILRWLVLSGLDWGQRDYPLTPINAFIEEELHNSTQNLFQPTSATLLAQNGCQLRLQAAFLDTVWLTVLGIQERVKAAQPSCLSCVYYGTSGWSAQLPWFPTSTSQAPFSGHSGE